MSTVKSEKFIAHLKLKWHGRNCPMCQAGNWNISDRVFELREYHGGSFVVGGSPIVPVVPVTCDNCGNTILVNAIVADAVEKEVGNG
jgi:hypothetical protein